MPKYYVAGAPGGASARSLELLRRVHEEGGGILAKSGIMLGLGETGAEVERTLVDLRAQGCDLVTIGQYLQPTPRHLPVAEYVHPDTFARWRARALELGFSGAASGPLVRSSFHADELAGATKPGAGGAATG